MSRRRGELHSIELVTAEDLDGLLALMRAYCDFYRVTPSDAAPEARGSGLAERLIFACVERCAQRGASALEWQTAPENLRAQAVYGRVGAAREQWLTYTIQVR